MYDAEDNYDAVFFRKKCLAETQRAVTVVPVDSTRFNKTM